MQVTLQVTSGPSAGKRVRLQAGQAAQVGRTEWADFSVPEDAKLAELHFTLQCTPNGCRLRDLNSSAGTLVDGAAVTDCQLRDGSNIIAGATTFTVRIEGGGTAAAPSTPAPQAASAVNAVTEAPPAVEQKKEPTAAELCQSREIELSDEARALLKQDATPLQFVDELVAAGQFAAAKLVLGNHLPKREAVWWGCLCVREVFGANLDPGEAAGLDSAEKWVAEPSEPNRRAAESARDAVKFKGPGTWLASAAFWSEGSMNPPDLPKLPPADNLTAGGISPALTQAATHADGVDSQERYLKFFSIGKEIALGKVELPGEASQPVE